MLAHILYLYDAGSGVAQPLQYDLRPIYPSQYLYLNVGKNSFFKTNGISGKWQT